MAAPSRLGVGFPQHSQRTVTTSTVGRDAGSRPAAGRTFDGGG
jgi:hypothetical protein